MESGSLQAVAVSCPTGAGRQPSHSEVGTFRSAPAVPVPDEPAAVVLAGAGRDQRRALLATLLEVGAPVPAAPTATYVVLRHGPARPPVAFLPGCRAPRPLPSRSAGSRAPRRIEQSLPDPLLRYVQFVDAPDDALGVPGNQVLLDTVDRAGALLYLLAGDRSPAPAEVNFLTEVAARRAAIFLAVPRGAGGARVALLSAVPALAAATWCAVDPETGDTGALRRALVEWAGLQQLDRAEEPTVQRTVRIPAGVHGSDWADRLAGRVRESDRRVRERLAADLADLHHRCARAVDDLGCAALPEVLDREVHALSVQAVAGCAAAVDWILDASVAQVLEATPDESVRRRVAEAVRRGLADDPEAGELDRVLLVTTTGGVATLTGARAVAALAAWSGPADRSAILPHLGVGLSGGCHPHWRKPANADVDRARAWLDRVVHAVELELAAELSRRLDAVRRSLVVVLADAVDHGLLLA